MKTYISSLGHEVDWPLMSV